MSMIIALGMLVYCGTVLWTIVQKLYEDFYRPCGACGLSRGSEDRDEFSADRMFMKRCDYCGSVLDEESGSQRLEA